LAAAWPPSAWDLKSLTLAAFYFNPELDLARSQWAAARAAVITAGERPNPNVSFAPGYNASTPVSQITPWILTLDLDFTLTTAGKRGYRIAQARRLSDASRLGIASTAWRVRSEVRRGMLDAYAASRRAAFLEQQQTIHQQNLVLLERQLAAGAISPFEVAQARLSSGTNQLALHDAQQQLAEARVRLAAALGVTVRALDGAALAFGAFDQEPAALPVPDVRRQAVLNRPDILGALLQYEASQSALQLEVARQYPDIHLGPGYQMDQDARKWTLGLAGLLPAFSRNRGPIAEAAAHREEAAANFTIVQNRAIEQIDAALAGYEAALAKVSTAERLYADRLELLRTANAQFAAGDISRLELGSIQLTLAGAELARFDARVNAQQALGGLEDAIQSPAVLADWLFVAPPRTPPASNR
jgi:outer membrane protein TolC